MNRQVSHFCHECLRFVCTMWSAVLGILTLSSVAVAHVLKADLLKSVDKVLSAESVVRSLSDPNRRSGAADCDLDVQQFSDALSRKELWALRVLDSSSFFITGILQGNTASLGNYDECLQAAPPDNQYWPLYSLVNIVVENKKNSSEYLAKSYDFRTTSKAAGNSTEDGRDVDKEEYEWVQMLTFHLGICWIRSCGAEAPGKAVADALKMAEGALEGTGYRLRVSSPLPGSDDVGLPLKLGRADWVVIFLCVVIGFVVLFGTMLDLAMLKNPVARGNPGWKLGFLAFSAYNNGRRLLTVGSRAPDSLTAICGLKVFSILWVMLGHRYRYMVTVPYMNKLNALERVKDWDVEIILGGPLAVDTFFTIGGVLNAYVFLIAMRKRRTFNFVQFFVHRYIRLTPALAMMIAITSTWLYHVGSGPIWLQLVADEQEQCLKHWWASLLYISNYLYPNEQCMMQSWYLMVDMQLHWFSVLILIPLWRWRRVAFGLLVFLIGVSCAIPFSLVYVNKYRTPLPTEPLTNPGAIDTSMENIYYATHSRATSYLVGLFLGYYLYRARYVVHRFRLGLWTVVAGWTLSCLLALIAVFAAYPLYQFDQEISIWSSAFYVGFYRLAWSLSIGWIIVACATGYGGPVNGFLSWGPFIVISRLVYGMYLTHVAVQLADIGSMRSSFHYNDFNMVEKAFSDFAISMGLALILCLTMESPIIALEKILLFRPVRDDAAPSASVATTRRSNGSFTPTLPVVANPSLDIVDVVSEQRQPQTNL